jgi:hypothetical protein
LNFGFEWKRPFIPVNEVLKSLASVRDCPG